MKRQKTPAQIIRKMIAEKLTKEETHAIYENLKFNIEQAKKDTFKEVLEYISIRGFRNSNYEINQVIKWLWEKVE